MQSTPRAVARRRRAFAACLTGLLLGPACAPGGGAPPAGDPGGPRTTLVALPPRPPFNRDSLLAVAAGLTFVEGAGISATDTVTPADCPGCPLGRITLLPERDAWRTDTAVIARGRFIARLRNETGQRYRRFALAPNGTSYWFVYRDAVGKSRSWYISDTDVTLDRWTDRIYFHRDPQRQVPHTRSYAEWIQRADDPPERDGTNGHGPTAESGPVRGLLGALSFHTEGWVACGIDSCCSGDP